MTSDLPPTKRMEIPLEVRLAEARKGDLVLTLSKTEKKDYTLSVFSSLMEKEHSFCAEMSCDLEPFVFKGVDLVPSFRNICFDKPVFYVGKRVAIRKKEIIPALLENSEMDAYVDMLDSPFQRFRHIYSRLLAHNGRKLLASACRILPAPYAIR